MGDLWKQILFGAIFFVVGLPFIGVGWHQANEADRLNDLPLFDLASLTQSGPGLAGTLEGKIAERNALPFRTFVAYVQERYEGEDCDDDGCDSIWSEIERQTPPLLLDLPEGRVRVINDTYYLTSFPVTWQASEELVAYETTRYQGFEIGSPVFVVGATARDGDTPAFSAEFIAGGDRAAYLADQRFGARLFLGLGALFSLIGVGSVGWLFFK